MDWLETAVSTITGAVAAFVAVGGLLGALGRMSQIPRARRRVQQAAALQEEAHSSLRGEFDALHKEESARYLAVVEGRIGLGLGWTILASVGALPIAAVVLILAFINGSTPNYWDETGVILGVFGLVYALFAGTAASRTSKRHKSYITAYRTQIGLEGTQVQAPEESLFKANRKFGEEKVHGCLVVATATFSAAFIGVSGFQLGRAFTDTGRAMQVTDRPVASLVLSSAIPALFILTAIAVVLLFPPLPHAGESLRIAADRRQRWLEKSEGGATSDSSPTADRQPETDESNSPPPPVK